VRLVRGIIAVLWRAGRWAGIMASRRRDGVLEKRYCMAWSGVWLGCLGRKIYNGSLRMCAFFDSSFVYNIGLV
jgi:hypothetical protein